MTETARHLAERVVPEVRTRQWVLSFPFQLRWALAFHHELVKSLARLTYAEIARRYLRLAREQGVVSPRGGAFFVIQRFGSDLRLNVHLHALFLDGASGDDDAFSTSPASSRAPTSSSRPAPTRSRSPTTSPRSRTRTARRRAAAAP